MRFLSHDKWGSIPQLGRGKQCGGRALLAAELFLVQPSPFFPPLGCSVSLTGTCRSQGSSSLPLSLAPTAGTATHVGKGPLWPSATAGSMKNRLHWVQSSQMMLNLRFPVLNHHGNTQSCFHLHSLKVEWKGTGNSGSLVILAQVILVILVILELLLRVFLCRYL